MESQEFIINKKQPEITQLKKDIQPINLIALETFFLKNIA
tara:strand:- start:279 stop:398 length:120 start_codon:yes stop_codon:yes gene_type:complete